MAKTGVNTLTLALTFAIIALSLVLLTGFAGEINLAALSFGAIAVMVVYHFGISGTGTEARTTLWGILLAAVVTALVGALIALPALRLRGLYLALATMAFGVFISRMVLTERTEREIFGLKFTLFTSGQLAIPRPKIGPIDFNGQDAFLFLCAGLFVAIGIGMVYLRHSGYGRRLTAMKDSPAASATLGMSVVRLKLSIFMMSAAIAGIGGVMMAAQVGTVNSDRFDIFLSLALAMITVVGGIGYVSGALFAGIFLIAFIEALNLMLKKFAVDYSSLEAIFMFFISAVTVLPATIGITMGKNPSGAVSDIVEGMNKVKQSKPLMITVIGLEAAIWALTATEVITNWHFVILTFANLILVPIVGGKFLMARAMRGVPKPVPPELIGIDRPFTDEDLAAMDQALNLDGVVIPSSTTVREEPANASA